MNEDYKADDDPVYCAAKFYAVFVDNGWETCLAKMMELIERYKFTNLETE